MLLSIEGDRSERIPILSSYFHFIDIFIYIEMITLNVQMGVNPLINHRPLYTYRH